MTITTTETPTLFADAETKLLHARTGKPLPRKKVGNNTYLHRLDEDTIAVRLHSTDVVTYRRDGTITLNTGGWFSVTTKARMNEYIGRWFSIGSERGTWYVHGRNAQWVNGDREEQPWASWTVQYHDGIVLNPVTMEEPAPDAEAAALDRADDATIALIDDYLKRLTKEVWQEIIERAQAEGVAGDCWYCSMVVPITTLSMDETGKLVEGPYVENLEHLRSHISKDERYYMASLGLNAVREAGYNHPEYVVGHVTTVKRSLRRYLRARLLVGNRSGRRPTAKKAMNWGPG